MTVEELKDAGFVKTGEGHSQVCRYCQWQLIGRDGDRHKYLATVWVPEKLEECGWEAMLALVTELDTLGCWWRTNVKGNFCDVSKLTAEEFLGLVERLWVAAGGTFIENRFSLATRYTVEANNDR